MDNEKIKQQIVELTNQLNQWSYEYYALDNPSVDDYTYDQSMLKLIELEKQYPQYKQKDSPTSRVGGIVLDKFEKIKHLKPMLSLDNIFDYEGLVKFNQDIVKSLNDKVNYIVEPKIDGLSISIVYENCKLKYACTRGDGQYGENVTNNILTINQIPLYINQKYKDDLIEIRGEVYMSISNLRKFNLENDKQLANTRNAASGALRNLDSSITKSRNLQVYFYYVFNHHNDELFQTQKKIIDWLNENKFPVANIIKQCEDVDQIWEHINYISSQRDKLDYEIDGVVIKLNQRQYYEEIGYTAKFPKWAIAYKFPPQIATTKLIDIITDVGRTGKINFIAQLEPVSLNGSLIKFASLHNLDFIKQKDIHLNDYIKIYKAGEVIPYVEGIDLTKRNNQIKAYEFDYLCPSCHQKVVNFDDNVDYYCTNDNCKQKILHIIEYFVSKYVMDIEYISYAIIKKLYEHHFIKDQWDLYELKNHKEAILAADLQIKDKSFNRIINSIENSKNNSLAQLIASFNIKNVGITIAKILAQTFQTLDNFLNTTYEQLITINIVGEKIASCIMEFISLESTKQLAQRIKAIGINTIYHNDVNLNNYSHYESLSLRDDKEIYKHKNVVITGSFSISRDEIKQILESLYQCKVLSAISKKTDYVLAGQNCGSKLDKAKELNIKIITNEFWNE